MKGIIDIKKDVNAFKISGDSLLFNLDSQNLSTILLSIILFILFMYLYI